MAYDNKVQIMLPLDEFQAVQRFASDAGLSVSAAGRILMRRILVDSGLIAGANTVTFSRSAPAKPKTKQDSQPKHDPGCNSEHGEPCDCSLMDYDGDDTPPEKAEQLARDARKRLNLYEYEPHLQSRD